MDRIEIKNWLFKVIFKGEQNKRPHWQLETDNFIKLGYIDSISIIRLMLEIEQQFNIMLTSEDISSNEFKTVNGLSKMIEREIGEKTYHKIMR